MRFVKGRGVNRGVFVRMSVIAKGPVTRDGGAERSGAG